MLRFLIVLALCAFSLYVSHRAEAAAPDECRCGCSLEGCLCEAGECKCLVFVRDVIPPGAVPCASCPSGWRTPEPGEFSGHSLPGKPARRAGGAVRRVFGAPVRLFRRGC